MTEHIRIWDTLEKVKDNPHELIETLLLLDKNSSNEQLEAHIEISKFINNEKIDIYKAALNAVSKGKNIFIVGNILSKLTNNIKVINSEIFLDFLTLYYEQSVNDFAANIFYEPVKHLAESPDTGIENVEKDILAKKDPRLYGYLNTIYVGYAKRDILIGYDKLMDMVNSDDNNLVSLGLRGLGLLHDISENLLLKIKNTCLSFCESEDEYLVSNSAFTLYKLIKYEQGLEEKVICLSNKNMAKVQYELLSLISTKDAVDQLDLHIVQNICKYDLHYKGISDQIDFICIKLIESNHLPDFLGILDHWICQHSIKEIQEDNITTVFKLSIPRILQKKEFFQQIVTNWLNSDEPRYHIALMDILTHFSTHKSDTIELDVDILTSLNFNDILYIIRKILGYIYDHKIATHLVASILKLKKISSDIEQIIFETFIKIFGDRAPLNTKLILEDLLKSNYKYSRKARSIINNCINQIARKIEQLDALGNLNELQPNIDNQIKLSRAFQKYISKASNDALGASALISSINKIKVKAGNGWFQYIYEKYSQITPMHKFTQTLEFPREMMLDEIGSVIERTAFKQAKRNEP